MDYIKLIEAWKLEEKNGFEGWNFSHIAHRMMEEPLPWDYDKIIRHNLNADDRLLDMGTGGGEYLLTLNHPYKNTFVTESYEPNFKLCQSQLTPLGIDVRLVFDDHSLPYEDNLFDLIINRHESFDIKEVYRILKPDGLFITQQVGGLNNKELSKFLIKDFKEAVSSEYTLDHCIKSIQNQGFIILESEEYFPTVKFFDIGALIYFAKIVVWEFPGFSVEKCFEELCQLQAIINNQGYVETKEHRFMIVSKKLK